MADGMTGQIGFLRFRQLPMQEHTHPELPVLLASCAHDMKNSMNLLNVTLENLLSGAAQATNPAYQKMVGMLAETKRLHDNLFQLLALYKNIGSAHFPFDPEEHAIVEFVEEVVARNHILLDARAVEFATEFPEDLMWSFDDDLVVGLIGHAVNNALHYTRDKIRLIVEEIDGFLEIRVEDNGSGYPQVILDAQVAVKAGVDYSNGSTGLGLYFSNEVAKMHKHRGRSGSVHLKNGGVLGGGCFVLHLP
jgi:signal transduction histidine kinase